MHHSGRTAATWGRRSLGPGTRRPPVSGDSVADWRSFASTARRGGATSSDGAARRMGRAAPCAGQLAGQAREAVRAVATVLPRGCAGAAVAVRATTPGPACGAGLRGAISAVATVPAVPAVGAVPTGGTVGANTAVTAGTAAAAQPPQPPAPEAPSVPLVLAPPAPP